MSKKRSFAIDKVTGHSRVSLLLSGPVDSEASALLGLECARLLYADYQITLDLRNVSSADGVGFLQLLTLWQAGVMLTNVPTHIAKKMGVVGNI